MEKKYEEICHKGVILQKAIDALDYPFYVINMDTYEIVIANDTVGIDLKSGKKYRCHEVTHRNSKPCNSEKDPCPIAEIRKTGKSVIVEHIHFDKDGNKRNVEVHAHPIFDENGKLVQMIEYSIDVTERKKIEEEIEKHAQELKKMNDLMMGRELKMVELKREIDVLKREKNN